MKSETLSDLHALLGRVCAIQGAYAPPQGERPTRTLRVTPEGEPYATTGVQLYVAVVYVHVPELKTREGELLELLARLPEAHEALASNNLDLTSYLPLGAQLGSQELALRLMGCLIELERAKLVTVGNLVQGADIPEEVVYAAAGRGLLSLMDVNLVAQVPA